MQQTSPVQTPSDIICLNDFGDTRSTSENPLGKMKNAVVSTTKLLPARDPRPTKKGTGQSWTKLSRFDTPANFNSTDGPIPPSIACKSWPTIPILLNKKYKHSIDNSSNDMSHSGSSGSGRSARIVDHTYRDFSHYLEHAGQVDRHKKVDANFPAKLHQMLSDPHFSHIIVWMPHGRAWRIVDKNLLISNINKYFALKRFHSFIRQLSGWGFKRLHQPGPDNGCYYHECFLRGIPRLTWLMRRVPTNTGKPVPHIEGEPDFYEIAKMHPLPPVSTDGHNQPSSQSSARSAAAVSAPEAAEAATLSSSMAGPVASAAALRSYPTSISQIYSSFGLGGNNQSSTEKSTASESTTTTSVPRSAEATGANPRSSSQMMYSNYGQNTLNPSYSEYQALLSAANNMASSTSRLQMAGAAHGNASGQNTFFSSSRESMWSQPRSDSLMSWETGATNSTQQATTNTSFRESPLQTDTSTATSTNSNHPAYYQSVPTNTTMMTNILPHPSQNESLSAPSFNNFQPNANHHVDNTMFPSHFPPGDPLSYNPYFYQPTMDGDGPASWSTFSSANCPPPPPQPFYSFSYPPSSVNHLHFDSSSSHTTNQMVDNSAHNERQQRQELPLSPLSITPAAGAQQAQQTNEQEPGQEAQEGHRKDKEPSEAGSGNEDLSIDFFGSLDF